MKITILPERTPEDIAYAAKMRSLIYQTRVVKPASTEQAESTKRTLARDPAQDAEWAWRTTIPLWTADRYAQWGGRASEASHFESVRRRAKSIGGDAVSEGASSVTPERRQLATRAFEYSGPAQLTDVEKERIVKLSPIPPPPSLAPQGEAPKSRWTKFREWLLGTRNTSFTVQQPPEVTGKKYRRSVEVSVIKKD